jgi:hypothetical protein
MKSRAMGLDDRLLFDDPQNRRGDRVVVWR